MQDHPALTCWNRHSNRRGAVLLLAVYLTSLLLLILGGISLQRTVMESRAAHVSRDTQQAFFLAEGALDVALSKLRTTSLLDGLYPPLNLPELPSGTSVTITTSAAQIVDRQTQRITRRIVATATLPPGTTSTVTATVRETGSLRGTWANGPLIFMGGPLGSGEFSGDLRSTLSTENAIALVGNIHPHGQLQIGPYSSSLGSWQTKISSDSLTHPGVWLGAGNGVDPTTEGEVADVPARLVDPIPSPFSGASCSGNLTPAPGQTLTIEDGNLNPPDLSGSASDNQIVLCTQYVVVGGTSKVIFHAPATIYVTGRYVSYGWSYSYESNFNSEGDFYAVRPGTLLPQAAPLLPNGTQIIMTKIPPAPQSGYNSSGQQFGYNNSSMSIHGSRFSGSLYGPESSLNIRPPEGSEYQIQYLVAGFIHGHFDGIPMAIGQDTGGSGSNRRTSVSVLSWTSP